MFSLANSNLRVIDAKMKAKITSLASKFSTSKGLRKKRGITYQI